MSKLLIEFAYMKGTENMIHINQSLQEERFKYTCIDCGEDLLIRDGEINRKHFSHRSDSECKNDVESHFRLNSIGWYHLIRGSKILDLRTRTLRIKEVLNNVNISSMVAPILVKTYTGKDIVIAPHKTKGYTQQMKYLCYELGLDFYHITTTQKGVGANFEHVKNEQGESETNEFIFIYSPVYIKGKTEYTKGFKKDYEKYKAKVTRLQQLKGEK